MCNVPLDSSSIKHRDIAVWSVSQVSLSSWESVPSDYWLEALWAAETVSVYWRREKNPVSALNLTSFFVVLSLC